jgi:predicted dehydrogenase
MKERKHARAGVIGPGGIGRVHIDALRRIGVPVTAVAGSSLERSMRIAAELEVPVACESVNDLVSRSDVDVVHVCTPNAMHVSQAMLAIEAGKHVVCEKPLAVSSAEAGALLRMAEARGVVNAVCYNYRYYPMLQAMRAAIIRGAIGRMHVLRGAYMADYALSLSTEDPDNWAFDSHHTGSSLSLTDIGVHWWDLLEHVSGQRIERVICAQWSARDPETPGADSVAILLRLEGGAIASSVISAAASGHGNTLELEAVGTKASLRWEQESAESLWQRAVGQPARLLTRRPDLEDVRLPHTLQLPHCHPQGYLDGFRDLMARVYEAVDGGAREGQYPTFADGLRGVVILEALLKSVDTGSWISVA